MIGVALRAQNEKSLKLTPIDNLRDASELLKRQKFDIILTDVNLSDASGFLVLQELIEFGNHTPVIVLSNITNWSMIIQSAEIGISDFLLKKTLDAGVLMRSVFYAIERRNLELKASWAENNYHSLVDALPVGLFRSDTVKNITYANSFFANMVDRTAESIIGNTVIEVIGAGASGEQFTQALERVMDSRVAGEFELCIERNPEVRFSVLCIATPFYNQFGKLDGVQCVVFDATFQRHLHSNK